MFYQVDAKVELVPDKMTKEIYLVDAAGIPEAEEKVIAYLTKDNLDYEITQVKKSSIKKVLDGN